MKREFLNGRVLGAVALAAILVAPLTNPVWTPLFAILAARREMDKKSETIRPLAGRPAWL